MKRHSVILVVAASLAGCPLPEEFTGTLGFNLESGELDRSRVAIGVFGRAGGTGIDNGLVVEREPPRCTGDAGGPTIPLPDPFVVTPLDDIPANATFSMKIQSLTPGPMVIAAWFDVDGDGLLTLSDTGPSEQCRAATRTIDDRVHALMEFSFFESSETFGAFAAPLDDSINGSIDVTDETAEGWTFTLDAESDDP